MALGGTIDVLTTDNPDSFSEEPEELQIYEKHNNLLHGNKRKKYGSRSFFVFFLLAVLRNWKTNASRFREKTVSKEFMRKYIHVAKAVTPVLTEEAANHIAEEYSRLRSQDQMGTDIARVS